MSEERKPYNPPAFPSERGNLPVGTHSIHATGMKLRDYFAARLMGEMIHLSMNTDGGWDADHVAEGCYRLADAMLKAREE